LKKDLQKEGNHAKIPSCVEEQRPPVNFPLEEVFGLPNIKSAKKRVLLSQARNARNKANRSALKTAIKKFEAAAAEGKRTEAEGAYKAAVKMVDQSVRKGVLHKNNAAHKKSAMTLKLSKI
jgi:small subunit ribosomal protein S20